MAIIDTRRNQMYPVLDAAQIATASRFASGPAQDFAPGEPIFAIDAQAGPSWLVLKGSIEVTRRDGLNGSVPVMTELPGQFSGEISQLSGRGSLAEGHAGPEGCTALPFDPAHLRALLIGSAELGEIVMRAFILRRVALLEAGSSGAVLVGRPGMPDLVRLQNFLRRNSYPFTVLDASDDEKGRALIEQLGVQPDELPLVVCPKGGLLRRPSDAETGAFLGITPKIDTSQALRRRCRRRRAGGIGDSGLWRVGRPVGHRPRSARFRRPGRRVGADRELSRLPDRHLGPRPDRTRLQSRR